MTGTTVAIWQTTDSYARAPRRCLRVQQCQTTAPSAWSARRRRPLRRIGIGPALVTDRAEHDAFVTLDSAAALFAADRVRRSQADALLELGEAKVGVGDCDGAVEAFHASRVLYVELGDPKADVVSERLSRLSDR